MACAANWQPMTAKLHSGCVRVSASRTTCCRHQLPLTGGRLVRPGYSCRAPFTGQKSTMLGTILQPDSIYEAIPSQLPLLPERSLVVSVQLSRLLLKS